MKDKTPEDILNDQLFYIGMTLKGFDWTSGQNLTDSDRYWLLKKCNNYWEEYERKMKKA